MRKILAVAFLLSAVLSIPSAAAARPIGGAGISGDAAAWSVFVAMTAPAASPRTKAVAFETWASDSDIFSSVPPHWPTVPTKHLLRSLAASAADRAAHVLEAPLAGCYPKGGKAGNFPAGACIGEEVQHNRPVFDTIVSNGLFTTAGLARSFTGGKPIVFPNTSIVVKADWILVKDILRWLPKAYKTADDVRGAYYTNMATLNGISGEYALAGMSVQSRMIPQWLWMTFEHRSNPGRCDEIGCHDDFGAVVPDVAPRATGNTDYGPCAKPPMLIWMFAKAGIAPVWNNYCLKGSQYTFDDKAGKPTVLANSVIERMNKGVPVLQTSCITCHAYAAFDAKGQPNYGALEPPPVGAVALPLPAPWKSYDYVWGLLAAH